MISVDELKLLLQKNKRNLLQELKQSKEAMRLIQKSTHTPLTALEKEKVKILLIDIIKSIPALTVFLLPGGSILLPLLIKLIPDILPSAFQDNSSEDKNKSTSL